MSVTVSGPMPIVQETSSRIVLRHNPRAAFYVTLGFTAALVAVLKLVPSPMKWLFAAAFGFFVFILVLFTLYRDELQIDLANRQWRRGSGFFWSIEQTRGALDEIPAVVMVLARRDSRDDDAPTWNVSIQAPAWKKEIVLGAYAKEEEGYRALETWSKKLRRDAVDRSGAAEVRTPWDALDSSLRDRAAAAAVRGADVDATAALDAAFGSGAALAAPVRGRPSEAPPAGSRIVVTRENGRKRIVMPPMGWNAGATFVTVFGGAFAGLGTVAALAGAHVIKGVMVNGRILDRPDWPMTALGSFFALIGYALIVAMIMGSRAREYVEDARERLLFGNTWLGLSWGEKALAKREIEGVDLSASPTASTVSRVRERLARERFDDTPEPEPGSVTDVRIRSDARVVRLGRYLPEADQRWLRDILEVLAKS